MSKLKTSLKYLRLSLLFAFSVFLIFLFTMGIAFAGTQLLIHFEILNQSDFERVPLFGFCLASVIIGTILSALFSRKPLKPMREIMQATDKIADGDYSVRLDLKGMEEFKTLSNKFNHMAEELGSVEMLRSDFVNNFSHEFKTPIVSIRGFAKALKWEDLTDKEREEYLDIIINESERLSDLSNNVLYLSKIQNQSILTDKHNYNLTEQIRLVIALLDKKFSLKNLEIIFDSEEYYITANEEMLKQVWINLLDNAIKFSPTNEKIQITSSTNDDNINISISNEGEGISKEALPHIFDRFYQGDVSHAANGNGLGLAIVKKIVQLHNGEIFVTSELNHDTTFTVTLPCDFS